MDQKMGKRNKTHKTKKFWSVEIGYVRILILEVAKQNKTKLKKPTQIQYVHFTWELPP